MSTLLVLLNSAVERQGRYVRPTVKRKGPMIVFDTSSIFELSVASSGYFSRVFQLSQFEI